MNLPFTNLNLTSDLRLYILDQTLLPARRETRELTDLQSLIEAITSLRVRGAPAIGVAAALGIAMLSREEKDPARLEEAIRSIRDCRPTAVNLGWACERMSARLAAAEGDISASLEREARAIQQEDEQLCLDIGRQGLGLLGNGMRLLTHCNAGALATAGIGTALAPIYLALSQGMDLTVYCDETRPLLQGARLTAWEMQQAGARTILICDNMAASLMAAGQIDAILVGTDRVAANGDIANKIGTLSLAVNAHYFGVPFYVCAPSTTLDPGTLRGAAIPIEQRPDEEVTELWYERRQAPADVEVRNPAFDVTPAALISAIVTDKRIYRPPYDFSRL